MAVAMARYTPRYTSRGGGDPRALLPEEDSGLSRAAIRVWYALAHRGALRERLEFSPSRLAPEIEMGRATIFAALRELTVRQFIERGRLGRLTTARCVTPRKGSYSHDIH